MARYRYKAIDAAGMRVRGEMVAHDEMTLFQNLKDEGKYLIQATVVEEKHSNRTLSSGILADFCRELGMLTRSGVSLVRALGIISKNDSHVGHSCVVYADLLRRIRQGQLLSDAMESMGSVFPTMLIHMFRVAESAGNLDQVALGMAEHYRKEHRFQAAVRTSLTYPKLLGALLILVVIILIGYILPQFEELFSVMEELPVPTRILYGVGSFFQEYWILSVVAAAAGMLLLRVVLSIEMVRCRLECMRIHMPILGKLWRMIYTARFAQTMSTLYAAGLPMTQAVLIAKNTLGNRYLERQLDKAVGKVRAGDSLSDAMEMIDGFQEKLAYSIRIGEETGCLSEILCAVSEDLSCEAEQEAERLVTCLEPMMILGLAAVVGFVVIAVMMPIYGSYSALNLSVYN